MESEIQRRKKNRINTYHHYYKRKGVYTFLWKNSLKIILIFSAIIVGFILFKNQIPDYDVKLELILNRINTWSALSIFFISETILGLIPPDLFIIWSKKFSSPYLMVSLLALLSYAGGIIAYFIGKYIGNIARVETWIMQKFSKHFTLIRKWGGVLIVFAALFPLPYSSICLVAGVVRFPFITFLLLGLFRFVRFFAYALILFSVV
ncbi:MAG: short-chain dehydrogenase [Flavobacteriales bacterium]|nr:short-chain dehydrogenase [Flavobacteriales bacterium]